MNSLLLAVQTGGEGQIEQIARTFGVDWPNLIAQIISFCLVSFILYRFAYRPVLEMLQVRRQQISQGIANAEQVKAELARTEAQRREVILQANAEATRLIEEARKAAAILQEKESQKAVAEAEQIIARAREAAARDQARMLVELRREVGRLAVQMSAKITGKILTPEDQRRLFEETARQMSTS
jgi:F-type H+-transporting ATPase subunit b